MSDLITPAEVPRYVPGRVICASDELGWRGVTLRGYDYLGQDVDIPPLRDYMIVSYRRGATPMERRFEGAWTHTRCAPGSVSLLTRAQRSRWNWSENIDVFHVYLTDDIVARVAEEALERPVVNVRLRDVLNVEDPVITAAVDAIRREAQHGAVGGALYVQALGTQLALHLLRNYSAVAFRERCPRGGLSAQQRRRVEEYVEAHLGDCLELATLADVVGLGVTGFSRRFKASFGMPPYAWVVERRVDRARRLVVGATRPLKQIAAECGFTDQAHMTRAFRARLGATPGALRREAGR